LKKPRNGGQGKCWISSDQKFETVGDIDKLDKNLGGFGKFDIRWRGG
jgi:hypothetical protein